MRSIWSIYLHEDSLGSTWRDYVIYMESMTFRQREHTIYMKTAKNLYEGSIRSTWRDHGI